MKRFYLTLLIPFLLVACGPSGSDKEITENAVEPASDSLMTFTANPQPVPEQEIETLEIGADAPYFNLPGVDGKYHSIDDYDDASVLAVLFTCNHCPTAQAYEDRIKRLVEDYSDKSVQVVAISPNSPIGLMYNELGYTDLGDTFEDMQIRAEDKNFNFPYLYDGDTHEFSMAYGPIATPHAFIFDDERKLRYVGRLDGIEKPGEANA
ncbi:MAG: redoxin domain-containing protein [Cyclobacteriaceae bacterium]